MGFGKIGQLQICQDDVWKQPSCSIIRVKASKKAKGVSLISLSAAMLFSTASHCLTI